MIFPLDQFVDIHTHILPGLDDGPEDIGESYQLAKLYVAAGVQRVIATPHFLPGTAWSATADRVFAAVESLREHLRTEGIQLKVEAGMEIAYHKRMLENIADGVVLPLGSSGNYLIESSFHGDQDGLLIMLESLLEDKQKIILAHPERIDFFQQRPRILERFVQKGLKIQVNSGSLLGHFGSRAMKTAEHFYQYECLHFIGSDAHNISKRRPLSPEEWQSLHDLSYGTDLMQNCQKYIADLFN